VAGPELRDELLDLEGGLSFEHGSSRERWFVRLVTIAGSWVEGEGSEVCQRMRNGLADRSGASHSASVNPFSIR
jgi:hypothetical protein